MATVAPDMQPDMREKMLETERLLDELSSYAPSSDAFSESLMWDAPKGPGKHLGRAESFTFETGGYTIPRQDSYSKRKASELSSFSHDLFNTSRKVSTSAPPAAATQPLCAVCGLVAAEISCHECQQKTCAFCDFQVHKVIPTVHTTRVNLCDNSSQPPAKRAAGAKSVVESARLLQEGASLDETILEFFKTSEFQKVVNKTDRGDPAPQQLKGTPSFGGKTNLLLQRAESIGALLGRADSVGSCVDLGELMDLPLMEPWPAPATQEPVAKNRSVALSTQAGPSAKALSEAARLAARASANSAKLLAQGAAAQGSAMDKLMEKRPRPANYQFKLRSEPVQNAVWRAARRVAHARFKAKQTAQRLNPKVRYKSRQKIADNRPRVKGRFVKTSKLVTAS